MEVGSRKSEVGKANFRRDINLDLHNKEGWHNG
jgi:hypothetical protein